MEILYTKIDTPVQTAKLNRYLRMLPPGMRDDLRRYKFSEEIMRRLFGRLLLTEAFESLYNSKRLLRNIEYNPYGKPYLPESDFRFSLSHSGKYVVLALACRMDLGIDIEEIKDMDITEFKNAFTEEEWKEIICSQCPLEQFYACWTKKESAAKADGRGLAIPLDDIVLTGQSCSIYGKKWYLTRIDIDPGYMIHLACESRTTITVREARLNVDAFINH